MQQQQQPLHIVSIVELNKSYCITIKRDSPEDGKSCGRLGGAYTICVAEAQSCSSSTSYIYDIGVSNADYIGKVRYLRSCVRSSMSM